MNLQDVMKQATSAAGMAELSTVALMLKQVMGHHQDRWMRVASYLVGASTIYPDHPTRWCGLCQMVAEPACDAFVLAAAQLAIVELLDGTRFSAGWEGPVETRDYSQQVV